MEFHLGFDMRINDAFKDLQDYFQEANASGAIIWFWNHNLDAVVELLGQLCMFPCMLYQLHQFIPCLWLWDFLFFEGGGVPDGTTS